MSELDGQDGCFDEHTPRAAFPTFSVYDKKKVCVKHSHYGAFVSSCCVELEPVSSKYWPRLHVTEAVLHLHSACSHWRSALNPDASLLHRTLCPRLRACEDSAEARKCARKRSPLNAALTASRSHCGTFCRLSRLRDFFQCF